MGESVFEIIHFKVNSWHHYNPRRDRKNYSWFRMQHEFFSDPLLMDLSNDILILFLNLICICSKKDSENAEIPINSLRKIAKIPKKKVHKYLEVLATRGVLTILKVSESVTVLTPLCLPTNERTNERTNVRTVEKPKPIKTQTVMAPRASNDSLCQTLIEMWNDRCKTGEQIQPVTIDPDKVRLVAKYWEATPPKRDRLVYWTEVFDRLFKSSFCRGEENNFHAYFKWAFQHHRDIMEGNYNGKKTKLKDEMDAWAKI